MWLNGIEISLLSYVIPQTFAFCMLRTLIKYDSRISHILILAFLIFFVIANADRCNPGVWNTRDNNKWEYYNRHTPLIVFRAISPVPMCWLKFLNFECQSQLTLTVICTRVTMETQYTDTYWQMSTTLVELLIKLVNTSFQGEGLWINWTTFPINCSIPFACVTDCEYLFHVSFTLNALESL